MIRWATLSSAISAPCLTPNGNIAVCTGSGLIIEFIENEQGLAPTANVLFESDTQPNAVFFEESTEHNHNHNRNQEQDDQQLIICDTSQQALITTNSKSKQSVLLCNEYENQSFKGPSHIIGDDQNRKFFTDSGSMGDTSLHSPKGSLFCITSGGILRPLAHSCLSQPTDLAFSPNYKCLYVAELFANRILRFVETSSGLFISSVFYQFSGGVGPTGIAVDADGNLFITRFEHKGLETNGYLTVIDASGKLIVELATVAPEVTGVLYQQSTNLIYITEVSTNTIFQIHADQVFKQIANSG